MTSVPVMAGRNRTARYLLGAMAARTGDSMGRPALLVAGLAITGSAASASVLLGALMASAAFGGPVFGVMLDRSERPGRVLAGALAVFSSALVVILAGLGHLPPAAIVAIALPAGVLGPAMSGGWTAQLPAIASASAQALRRATALDAMTYDAAGLLGPALAGITAALAGAPAAVIASAALIGAAIPAAAALPARDRSRTVPNNSELGTAHSEHSTAVRRRSSTPRELAADLRAGFRAVGGNRPLRRATVVTVVSCMGEGMFVACCPLLGAHCLGGADRGALLLSVGAVSGLAANTLMARNHTATVLRPDTLIGLSTAVLALSVLLTATREPLVVIGAAALMGVAEGPQLTALLTVRHREAPEQVRGQVFTIGASLKTTAYALGAPLAGTLAVRSLTVALFTTAAVQATAALTYLLTRAAPRRTRQTGPT